MKVFVVGGVARSLLNFRGPLLRSMLTVGHTVYTAAGETSPAIREQLKDMGVEHFDIPLERAGLNPLSDAKVMHRLVEIFRRVRPNLTLNYTIKPVIYGSIAARLVNVPKICSMITGLGYSFGEGGAPRRILRTVTRQLYRISLKSNSVVFFQNPEDRSLFLNDRLFSKPEQAILVNGSGVDCKHYSPAPFPEIPSFLLIARLIRDKGILEYLAAARKVRQEYPQVKFYLVGGIDSNPACISQKELNTWVGDGTVEYLGRLDDVRPAIANSSVYVLPSYREGTPRTILEAMALGRPIITTNAPGCKETIKRASSNSCLSPEDDGIIEGENGFLAPVKNSAKLAEAMKKLISHPGLIQQMGAASRSFVVEKYDVHKVNAAMMTAMAIE